MSRPPQLDYDVVEQFLTGELNLAEVSALRSIPHATRALVAQTLVLAEPKQFLAEPKQFLAEPYTDLVLAYPIRDFYSDIFGWSYDSIMQASRIKGLHASGTGKDRKRVTLVISPELRALFKRHKKSSTIVEAIGQVSRNRGMRVHHERQREEQNEERALRIFNTTNFIEDTFGQDVGQTELTHIVWLLRRRMAANHGEFITDPRGTPHYSRDLENRLMRLEKEREAQAK